ncbi:gp26 family baseplate hub assembly chaperone [bacterium]|jgi:hypothetical protein|nr:gp26 family baseplate hub assembly chaperone [bacterium]MDB4347954.1 gp26 family baseplate hub assembly chaperone [bacterium]MDB4350067.1 gp26 family baseplate hub assembly chaperone [bacterium]
MALPKLNDIPQYELDIPSTGQTVKFRPFLVKEQKILLIAYESQDKKQILTAMLNTIESCVHDSIDVKKLSTFDVDYMFTQIRSKSVGEKTKLNGICNKCSNSTEIEINLEEATFDYVPNKNNIVNVSKDISIQMRYPSYFEIINNPVIISDESTAAEIMYETLMMSMESVMTEEENILISDEPRAEVESFINSLNNDQFKEINSFLENIPKLKYQLDYTCSSCGETNKKVLEGLDDFFS